MGEEQLCNEIDGAVILDGDTKICKKIVEQANQAMDLVPVGLCKILVPISRLLGQVDGKDWGWMSGEVARLGAHFEARFNSRGSFSMISPLVQTRVKDRHHRSSKKGGGRDEARGQTALSIKRAVVFQATRNAYCSCKAVDLPWAAIFNWTLWAVLERVMMGTWT